MYSANQQLFKSKKEYLEGFAVVVHLLGKQNIAFCGHCDGECFHQIPHQKKNEGNFKTVLNLLIARRDSKIAAYVQQAPRNAINLSWKIQKSTIFEKPALEKSKKLNFSCPLWSVTSMILPMDFSVKKSFLRFNHAEN